LVEEDEEVRQGLGEFILESRRIWRLLATGTIGLTDILQKGILEVCQAGSVETLRVNSVIDDLETYQTHYVGCARTSREEARAGLPPLLIFSQLVQILEGLCLQGLVGGWAPENFDGILDLAAEQS
jgi:hypothetical protein